MKSGKKREVRRIRGSVRLAMYSASVEHSPDGDTVANGQAVYDYESGGNHCDHDLRCDWCCLQISEFDGGSCFRCEKMFHVDCFWLHLEVNRRCSIQIQNHSAPDTSIDMVNVAKRRCHVAESNGQAESDVLDSSMMSDTSRNIFAWGG